MAAPTATDTATLAQLRALLGVAGLVRSQDELSELLQRAARTVGNALGFGVVVVNLARPAWDDYEVVVVEGCLADQRDALLGQHVPADALGMLLNERFHLHGAYFIPRDEIDFDALGTAWLPGEVAGDGPDAWDPDDALIAPMTGTDGRMLGFLSLDDPLSRRRPQAPDMEVIGAVAGLVGGVIEAAQLSAAAARHRTAVEHLLRASSELAAQRSREDMLRAVCEGVRDALGFEKVTVLLDSEPTGRARAVAAVGWGEDWRALPELPTAVFGPLLAPELRREGCVLLRPEEVEAIAGPLRSPYESRRNGRGPLAWNRHWLMVPLEDRTGRLLGALWADDPHDRLLPTADGLHALRAFANHAVTAIESAAQLEQLRELAEHDPLTGLRNRRGFEPGIRAAIDAEPPLALLICDLDHFKRVNDTLGHTMGDEVLRRASRLLRGCTRAGDVPTRLGGEEFAIVLPGTDERAAVAVADRLRREIREACSDLSVPVSMSVGVAVAQPGDAPAEVIKAASRALFAAKRLGRDRVVVHHPDTLAVLDVMEEERGADHLAATLLLAETLDMRDVATWRHSETVGRFAQQTAIALGLAPERVERIRVAGVLHDLGKLGIPDSVLRKPGALTDAEWEEMRRHPELGARILEHAHLGDVAGWVLAHHERIDGKGYPRGLAGDEIPLESRILAVADAYEAMTAERPYRKPLAAGEARAELLRCAGAQFDPVVVEAFLRDAF